MVHSLGSLTLGIVYPPIYTRVSRSNQIGIPGGIGASRQDLGLQSMQIDLSGVLTGSTRYDNFDAFERARDLGESMKLDLNTLKTVIFIEEVEPSKDLYGMGVLYYSLVLEEALFRQISPCDSTSQWSVVSGGGTFSAINSSPTPKEGDYAIKLVTTTPGASVFGTLKYDPADLIDVNDLNWVSFWYRTNNITNLETCEILLYVDASNYASYTFTSEVQAVDTWYKIRVHHDSFTVTGTMEWDEIDYILIRQEHTTDQTFTFIVDDLGAYE
jgi:hypothetical protein